ncbi:unnamed protein product [Brassica oleracea]|uniref:Uncharacterized protein n=2 Tax=Brassica oleracea TaxID=3712 RepID=A0A0D3DS17_BRAOL
MNIPPDFKNTKLMTCLTYTLDDEIEGPFEVGSDGSVILKEEDEIVKQLEASGKPNNDSGKFFVPSYPKGRGGSTGYGNTVALLGGGRGDEEVLSKENVKNTAASVEERSLEDHKEQTGDRGSDRSVRESLTAQY